MASRLSYNALTLMDESMRDPPDSQETGARPDFYAGWAGKALALAMDCR